MTASLIGPTRRWTARIDRHEASDEDLVGRLLTARGLENLAKRDAFLKPAMNQLHDPGLLPDIDLATDRLLRALRDGERIAIFGDYDVDGITASAVLWRMFHALHPEADVVVYLPHRIREGYGPNTPAMRSLADDGAAVIVTVDCGCAAVEAIADLRATHPATDVIVTDHHALPGDGSDDALPPAFAIVHPARLRSEYPFHDLCGAGVAFKLAWRLATVHSGSERVSPALRELLLDMLGLAAAGTVADVVPMIDENRAICAHGLGRLAKTKLPGVRALLDVCGRPDTPIDATRIGFDLGPRLNACGRLGDAADGFQLLITHDRTEAQEIAERLDQLNTQRRAIEKSIVAEAEAHIAAGQLASAQRSAIVLLQDDWHPGVIGIACSRLVERFHRPVVLLSRREDGVLVGSGRSVDAYDLNDGLAACSDHLLRFGGHPMAAGLQLEADQLSGFAESFIAHASARLAPEDLTATHLYDCDARIGELTASSVAALERLGPFGRANPKPVFRFRDLRIAAHPELLGREGAHMSLRLADDQGRGIRALAWRHGQSIKDLALGQRLDILATPTINEWRGQTRVELELRCVGAPDSHGDPSHPKTQRQADSDLASV